MNVVDWWRRGKDQWRRRRELPGEYEALAREFALLTAECLEAKEQLNVQRKIVYDQALDIQRHVRERHSMLFGEVPGLTPGEMERLALLGEECGEVMRAVGKILRYGWESSSPFGSRVNRASLERELGSVRAVLNLMLDAGDVRLSELQGWQRTKKLALAKWTLYQACSMPREAQRAMTDSIRTGNEN